MLHLVYTSIPHLSSRWNLKKTVGISQTCFGVRVPRTLDFSTQFYLEERWGMDVQTIGVISQEQLKIVTTEW